MDGCRVFSTASSLQTTGKTLPQVGISYRSSRAGTKRKAEAQDLPSEGVYLLEFASVRRLVVVSEAMAFSISSLLGSSRTKQMSKAVPTAQQLLDFFNASQRNPSVNRKHSSSVNTRTLSSRVLPAMSRERSFRLSPRHANWI